MGSAYAQVWEVGWSQCGFLRARISSGAIRAVVRASSRFVSLC